MVLDIVLFREKEGGNLELVKESQRRRYKPVEQVDKVVELDTKWKKLRYDIDQTKAEINKIQKEISEFKKAKEDAKTTELIPKKLELEKKIPQWEQELKAIEDEREKALKVIGNIVHASVPVSDNEDNNGLIKKWGEFPTGETLKRHFELLYLLDGYDSERGVKVAGHRGYFLKGIGVQLNQAIISYSLSFLLKKKYILLQPPYFMKRSVMANTAQLEQFDEELYKVGGDVKET